MDAVAANRDILLRAVQKRKRAIGESEHFLESTLGYTADGNKVGTKNGRRRVTDLHTTVIVMIITILPITKVVTVLVINAVTTTIIVAMVILVLVITLASKCQIWTGQVFSCQTRLF